MALLYMERILTILSVLYVIVLSAALDLVPPSTPKGLVAFCNIAPSLVRVKTCLSFMSNDQFCLQVAKGGWPYLLRGRIRYWQRVISCCLLSFLGMIVSNWYSACSQRCIDGCPLAGGDV